MASLRFEMVDRFSPHDLLHDVALFGKQIRGNHGINALADHFFSGIAEYFFGGGVPADHDAIHVLADDGVIAVFDDLHVVVQGTVLMLGSIDIEMPDDCRDNRVAHWTYLHSAPLPGVLVAVQVVHLKGRQLAVQYGLDAGPANRGEMPEFQRVGGRRAGQVVVARHATAGLLFREFELELLPGAVNRNHPPLQVQHGNLLGQGIDH